MMNDTIYQLVYCSRNAVGTEVDLDAEVLCILDASRRNNSRDKVTGALLFSAGSFAQVLEGPLSEIERTFERIQRDPRHADVVVLHIQRSGQREFADWSMAYAGKLAASSDAGLALSQACGKQGRDGADAVLALLRDLVAREEEWAAAG